MRDRTTTPPDELTATTVIEVYADICCPFAHVGLRSVLERRQGLGRDDVVLEVRAWPLELVNGMPLDPATTAEHVLEIREQVAPELFRRFDPEHFPTTTLPALALVTAAYRQDLRLGETVSIALRDALFVEGRDISRRDVLSIISNIYGVHEIAADHDAMLDEWHQGEARDVKGSPHFFCRDGEVFCPSLQIGRNPDGRLRIRRNREGLDAFLARCIGVPTMSGRLER